MKSKVLLIIASIMFFACVLTQNAHAQEKASVTSATLQTTLEQQVDDSRGKILKKFLESYNSPLAQYADLFVSQADLYKIDWRLVAAISGVESTFGKEVPCANAWGWGIPDGNHIFCFASYDDGIRTISHDLRVKYMGQWGAQDVYSIGRIYAASPAWAGHVEYFMDQMTSFAAKADGDLLSISL